MHKYSEKDLNKNELFKIIKILLEKIIFKTNDFIKILDILIIKKDAKYIYLQINNKIIL